MAELTKARRMETQMPTKKIPVLKVIPPADQTIIDRVMGNVAVGNEVVVLLYKNDVVALAARAQEALDPAVQKLVRRNQVLEAVFKAAKQVAFHATTHRGEAELSIFPTEKIGDLWTALNAERDSRSPR